LCYNENKQTTESIYLHIICVFPAE